MGERARRAENKRRDGMREWQLYECAHIPHVMLLLNEITGNSPDEVPYGGVRLGVCFPRSAPSAANSSLSRCCTQIP